MENRRQHYLVINIGDIHDKLDIITKVIGHDSPKHILCQIVSTPTAAVKTTQTRQIS
jgi:hypothetical protein